MASFVDYLNSDRPTLVDFYADWCGPCKMMAPVLHELSAEIGDRAKVIKVDVDKNPKVSVKYGIRSIPTLILFRKGQILWRHSGTASKEQLKSVIHQHA